MPLYDLILKLKQESNQLGYNPVLQNFELDDCQRIDLLSNSDNFIRTQSERIKKLLRDMDVEYNQKYNSALDIYNEVLIYLDLKEKFFIEKVVETSNPTPDFKLSYTNGTDTINYYIEVKTLSYSYGTLNYKNIQNESLENKIKMENDFREGKNISISEQVITPLNKFNIKYAPNSPKYVVETIIEKIFQNIKDEQFKLGDTILIIEMKQIPILGTFLEAMLPVYIEKMEYSLASGVLWNIAFAKQGNICYKSIEFAGKENIDGQFERNGILIDNNFIKAICFKLFENFKIPRYCGFYRKRDADNLVLLTKFCDLINDDYNSNVWELNRKLYNIKENSGQNLY
jgi:hypothetical protein